MKLRLPHMLLAAVIACLGSFSVATAADYAVNSADEFVTAWNQAAASNEASTITITVPSGSDNITLTQEQRAQLNAISGTGNVTIQMTDASNKLVQIPQLLMAGILPSKVRMMLPIPRRWEPPSPPRTDR